MNLSLFKLTLSHDNGPWTVVTAATSKNAAQKIIQKAEGCPESAIIKIDKIKNL